jgi:hypothetical protein
MSFIVDGIYELTVGGETLAVGPGTIVFIPRDVVHRFKNSRIRRRIGSSCARPVGGSRIAISRIRRCRHPERCPKLLTDSAFTGEKVVEISGAFDTNFPTAP